MKKLLTLLFLILSFNAIAQTSPIKNNWDSPPQEYFTKQEVLWVYSLKTRFWSDGTRITVFYLDFNHPVHISFVREVLGVSLLSFQNSVETYINLGVNSYFRKAQSERDMYYKVARTLGAVGYVSSKLLLVNDGNNNVKEIVIID